MADSTYIVDRANLHYVREQISRFLGDIDERLDIIEAGGAGIVADYLWTNTLSGDPTEAHCGTNNTDRASVTEVRIHRITTTGNDLSPVLLPLAVGSTIAIVTQTSPAETALFTTTAESVLVGNYFTIAVTPAPYTGQGMPDVEDEPIHVSFLANTSAVDHDNLVNVTEDQHHPKLHDLGSHTDVDLITNAPLKTGQGIYYDEVHGTWGNRTGSFEVWPTGLADGGEMNIAPTASDVEAIAGTGVVIDNYTDPLSPPVLKGLNWPTINEPIAEPAVAGAITWISIGDTGVPAIQPYIGGIPMFVGEIRQYSQAPSPTLQRQEVFLGVLVYNGVFWKEVSSPKVINQVTETLREVLTTVLPLTHIIEGGATHSQSTFELRQDAGTLWENNRNWHISKSDPNREALPARDPLTFQYVNRDFTDVGAPTSTVDPSVWDNAGTVEPVGGAANTTTIQRLFIDPADNFWMLWGQNTYPNFQTAAASISADDANTIVPYLLENAILLGHSVSEKAKTDWDVDEAVWMPVGSGAGGGGGGTPITDHDNLNGITPDNHHFQIHKLYGEDASLVNTHEDIDDTNPIALYDLLAWNGTKFDPQRRTRAVGDFVNGTTYYDGDELYNGSDLSECVVDGTTSYPYVAPTGTPEYIYTGVGMVNDPTLASQIIFGNRYESTTQAFYISGYRVNVVAGNEYRITLIVDPLGTPIFSELAAFEASTSGWLELALEPVAIPPGTVFDLIATVNEPNPTPVIITALYDYQTPQNAVPPIAGQIIHGRSQQDEMLISYTDNNATDRTALIQGLSIGDEISDGVLDWAVQANSDQGTYATIIVAPSAVSVAGTKNFDFQTVAPTPISVPNDPLYWPTSPYPTIQGLLGVDITYLNIVPDTNAYGTDILIQPAYIPDPTEWRLKVIAGQGGSGGGEFVPTVFAGAGTTGYVPDPVSESGRSLLDDGSWGKDGGHWTANGNDIYNNNSGNVGIGTTNPLELLHVGDGSDSSQVSETAALFSKNGATAIGVRDATGNVELTALAGYTQGIFGTVTNHPLYLKTNNQTHITVASAGNVGIGTTSPDTRLHVHHSTDSETAAIIENTGVTSSTALRVKSGGTGSGTQIFTVEDTADTIKFMVRGDGNVGIGTTIPTKILTVVASGSHQLELGHSDGNKRLTLGFDGSANIGDIGIPNGYSIADLTFTNISERMRITSAGKILVGKTVQQHGTPTLDSAGSMNATQGIYCQDVRFWTTPPQNPSQPSDYPTSRSALFLFEDTIPTGRTYDSSITVQGWDGTYNKWQLIGDSNNFADPLGESANKWYLRTGNNTAGWGALNEIVHSGNAPWIDDGTQIYPRELSRNVGIGTTSPTLAKLVVEAGAGYDAVNVNDGKMDATVSIRNPVANEKVLALHTYASGSQFTSRSTIFSFFNNGSNSTGFDINNRGGVEEALTSGATTFSVADSEKVRITYDGSVAIGTTSTSFGKFSVYDAGNVSVSFRNPTCDYRLLAVTDGDARLMNYTSGGRMTFWTEAAERMRIDSAGNVGIGLTIPTEKLHINGSQIFEPTVWRIKSKSTIRGSFDVSHPYISSSADGLIYPITVGNNMYMGSDGAWAKPENALGGSAIVLGAYNNGSGDIHFWSHADNNDVPVLSQQNMVITGTGNVGIGAVTPGEKLQINGTFAGNTYVKWTNASAPVGLDIGLTGAGEAVMWHRDAHRIRFGTSNIERMVIDSAGRVSVGSPTTGSAAAGSVNVADNFYINGVPIATAAPDEGTWTPQLSGVTYTPSPAATGYYQRSGNQVVIYGRVSWTSLNTADSSIFTIVDLPYTVNQGAVNCAGGGACTRIDGVDFGGVASKHIALSMSPVNNTTTMRMNANVSLGETGDGALNINYNNCATSGFVEFTVTYRTTQAQ